MSPDYTVLVFERGMYTLVYTGSSDKAALIYGKLVDESRPTCMMCNHKVVAENIPKDLVYIATSN